MLVENDRVLSLDLARGNFQPQRRRQFKFKAMAAMQFKVCRLLKKLGIISKTGQWKLAKQRVDKRPSQVVSIWLWFR